LLLLHINTMGCMIFESPDLINKIRIDEEFNWILTRFIVFELERSQTTIPKTEIERIDRLIVFHENLENYEICKKLLTYKTKIENV
jgi:hypothetical protein